AQPQTLQNPPSHLQVDLLVDVHGDVAGGLANRPPLQAAPPEQLRVGQEMDARLRWEGEQDREVVEPVEVIGDQYVGAVPRNLLAPADVEAKDEAQDRRQDRAQEPVGGGCPALDRE